jgi:hypothetical protein
MSEAQKIMAGNLPAKEEAAPTNDQVIEMSGDLLGVVSLAYGIPADFDGCAVSVLREPGTNRLMAVILSPVDMHGEEPFPRYQVNPDHIPVAKTPKLVLAS